MVQTNQQLINYYTQNKTLSNTKITNISRILIDNNRWLAIEIHINLPYSFKRYAWCRVVEDKMCGLNI
jgi:hypothetical protein